MKITDKGDYFEMKVEVKRYGHAVWIDGPYHWPESNSRFIPTFTRVIRRLRPPFKPAGLELASSIAIENWEKDNFCRQVYFYEDWVMPKHNVLNHRRMLLISEKEIRMGFDKNYTRGVFKDDESR